MIASTGMKDLRDHIVTRKITTPTGTLETNPETTSRHENHHTHRHPYLDFGAPGYKSPLSSRYSDIPTSLCYDNQYERVCKPLSSFPTAYEKCMSKMGLLSFAPKHIGRFDSLSISNVCCKNVSNMSQFVVAHSSGTDI